MRMREIVLLKPMNTAKLYPPADQFTVTVSDTIDGSNVEYERVGDEVTLRGASGTIVLPWSSVAYVVPVEAVKAVAPVKAGKR